MVRCLSILIILCSRLNVPANAQEWGDVTSKVVIRFKDPPVIRPVMIGLNQQIPNESLLVAEDGGLANVVVYVRTRDVPVNPTLAADVPKSVTMTFTNSTLRPRVAMLWIGQQTLQFNNADVVGFNPNVQPLKDESINPLLQPGDAISYRPKRQQNIPVPISDNIKPWIKAYLVPRNNPYATVTDAKGRFRIARLPAQSLEFQMWHEGYGYLDGPKHPQGRFTVDVKAGDNKLDTIVLER